MDVSIRTTMKGAAKCDKHCELRISVNRQRNEHVICFWDFLKACVLQNLFDMVPVKKDAKRANRTNDLNDLQSCAKKNDAKYIKMQMNT